MKMYKKSDLTIIDGMLVTPAGDIVMPDRSIVEQANELETKLQMASYLSAQPEATPAPSLDGFKRTSVNDKVSDLFKVSTPLMDMKAKESLLIMDEIDDIVAAGRANDMLASYSELASFASVDYVVDTGNGSVMQFDTPTIGSVLDLTIEKLSEVIACVCGMEPCGSDEEDDEDVESE